MACGGGTTRLRTIHVAGGDRSRSLPRTAGSSDSRRPMAAYTRLCLGFMPVASPRSPRLNGALEDRTGIFRALRRRSGLILTVALPVAAVAVVASLQRDPSYRSDAVILVRPIPLPGGSSPSAVNMATEEELVQSPDVVAKVRRTLDGSVSSDELVRELDVARSERENAEVLLLTYVGADPDEARVRVQAFADAYLESRRAQALSAFRANQQALRESIPLLEAQTRSLTRQAASTSDRVRRRSLLQQAGLLQGQVIARETSLTGAHATPDVGSVVQMASAATEVPSPGPRRCRGGRPAARSHGWGDGGRDRHDGQPASGCVRAGAAGRHAGLGHGPPRRVEKEPRAVSTGHDRRSGIEGSRGLPGHANDVGESANQVARAARHQRGYRRGEEYRGCQSRCVVGRERAPGSSWWTATSAAPPLRSGSAVAGILASCTCSQEPSVSRALYARQRSMDWRSCLQEGSLRAPRRSSRLRVFRRSLRRRHGAPMW